MSEIQKHIVLKAREREKEKEWRVKVELPK